MQKTGLAEQIEAVAAALVLTDPEDLRSVTHLLQRFEQLAESHDDPSLAPVIPQAAAAAGKLCEAVILDDVSDKKATIDAIGRAISAMQEIVCDGHDPADVAFPPELGLAASGSAGSEGNTAAMPSRTAAVDREILPAFVARARQALDEMRSLLSRSVSEDSAGVRTRLDEILGMMEEESAAIGIAGIAHVCREARHGLGELEFCGTESALDGVCDLLATTITDVAEGKPVAPGPDFAGPKTGAAATSESDGASTNTDEAFTEPAACDNAPRSVALEADPSLLNDFINEAREHIETADVQLLTLEDDPENGESLNAVFRSFHTIKGVAGFLALEDIADLAHEAESLLDLARKGRLQLRGAAIDVTFDATDMMKRLVEIVTEAMTSGSAMQVPAELSHLIQRINDVAAGKTPTDSPPAVDTVAEGPRKLGEVLIDQAGAAPEHVYRALAAQKEQRESGEAPEKLGQIMVKQGTAVPREVAQALRQQRAATRVREMVKVDTERLDLLLDTIGELVTTEVMVTQDPEIRERTSPRVAKNLSLLSKISRELQEIGMSMRMMSIRGTFQKTARLVRDLARKAGKDIELTTEGEDTELDRSLIDQINDPLVHMIRNSVDHGIEDAAGRKAANKRAKGRIHLRAFHEGGRIHIHVSDDGGGLDREAIRRKAVERGLISAQESTSDSELYNLIFEAGFSTAEKVTEVSGRGVGMDVVRRNIEGMHGHVDIDSKPGLGATFHMDLPLTLAIIDGMMVRVREQRYIIPVLTVAETILPRREMLSTVVGRGEMLSLRGNLLPLFRLARLFGVVDAGEDLTGGVVVVVESGAHRVGLLVDELLGQQQTVIKTLSHALGETQGISGATIMADGRVGLILDVAGIVALAHERD